jgi:hypothetical protein
VLFFDEFDKLNDENTSEEAHNACLEVIRSFKNNRNKYVVKSVISIGTFGILALNQKNPKLSPFNVADGLAGDGLTKEQVEALYAEFANDRGVQIDSQVVENIFILTSGYV